MRSNHLALVFIAAMENVNASSAVKLHKNIRYTRKPRQLGAGPPQYVQPAQPTTTSSFDYWWPYPAWTATASVGTTSAIAVPTTLDTTIGTPLPTSSAIDNSASSAAPTTTFDAFASSTSSPSPSSSTSSPPPPPTSAVSPQPHPSTLRNFITNPHILIPLLASVLGAVLLALFLLWFLCKRCRRRRHRNRDQVRYYYHPSGGQGQQEWHLVRGRPSSSRWKRLFRSREEPEDVVLGPRYVGVVEDDVDATTADVEKDVERLGVDKEWDSATEQEDDEDPFLLSKPKRAQMGARSFRDPGRVPSSSAASAASRRPLLPALSLLRDSFDFGAGEEEEDEDDKNGSGGEVDGDDDERVPWESLRHKSIKRAILAKVDEERRWTDSMRGLRSAKAVVGAGARFGGSSAAALEGRDGGRSRSRSTTRTDWSRGERREEEGERGFRIVVESPPPPRIPMPGGKSKKQAVPWSLASAFPFPLFSTRQEVQAGGAGGKDPYTPIPTRMKSGTRSRGSSISGSPVRVSPAKNGAGRHARPVYTSSSPSVLRMQSPPSVMTPEMESALCFTPVVGSSARMGRGAEDVGRDSVSREGVHSPRRGRLVKSVIKARTDKATEPEPGTIYTKTYRDRTDRAMRRVEAIVESGWNERGRARD